MQSKQPPTEGVIKYRLDFVEDAVRVGDIRLLNVWRSILHGFGWLGQDARRYSGYAFGNVSQRLDQQDDRFVISASQTGQAATLDATGYSRVETVDFERMAVQARGRLKPSSEALTHAMIYRLGRKIGCVLHVHDPRLWRHALSFGYPASSPDIEYGTAGMVHEVERLYRETALGRLGVLAMRGHEDGVIAFGADANQAGLRLLQLYLEVESGD
jgi:ribulose-5-phosphate 4-epimerase/fuculose-1-phosphate aldolase